MSITISSRHLTTLEERKTMKKSTQRFNSAWILAGIAAVCATTAASADTYTWTGGSTVDSNWKTAANWDAVPVPSWTSDLVFAGTTRLVASNDLGFPDFRNLTFDATAGAFTLTSPSPFIDNNGVNLKGDITNSSTNNQLIQMGIFAPDHTTKITTTVPATELTMSGANFALGFTKEGAGTLTLTTPNTCGGLVTLNAGRLNLNNLAGDTALGNAMLIINGGYLGNTSGSDAVCSDPMTWNASFGYNGGAGAGNKLTNPNNNGPIMNADITVTTDNGILQVNGITANGYMLTKNGPGTLMVPSPGLPLTVNAGLLQMMNDGGSYGLTVNGGTVDLADHNRWMNKRGPASFVTITGGTIQNGALYMDLPIVANVATGTATISADLYDFSGTGAVTLTKNGAGTLTLSGSAYYFDGGMFLNAGRMNLNSTNAIGANGGSRLTIGDGTTLGNTSGADQSLNNRTTWNGNFRYEGTGNQLGITGNVTWGVPDVTITVDYTTGTAAANALTLGWAGAASSSLTKNGAGDLIFPNNGYKGDLTVNNGLLKFGGATDGNITMNKGTLDLGGSSAYIFVGKTLTFGSDAASNVTIQNGTLNIDHDFTFNVAGHATISASLDNGYNADGTRNVMTKDGSGTLSFTGTDIVHMTDTMSVKNGTLEVAKMPNYSKVTVADGATFKLTQNAANHAFSLFWSMNVAPGAHLDFANNDVLVINGSLAAISQSLTLVPSPSGSSPITTTGAMTGDIWTALHGGDHTFDGNDINAGCVILKYVDAGDADMDGKITATDFAQLDASYLKGTYASGGATWFQGDFNHDGIIDYKDFILIDFNYGKQSPGGLANAIIAADAARFGSAFTSALTGYAGAVPEPASIGLLALGALGLLGRRRSR